MPVKTTMLTMFKFYDDVGCQDRPWQVFSLSFCVVLANRISVYIYDVCGPVCLAAPASVSLLRATCVTSYRECHPD